MKLEEYNSAVKHLDKCVKLDPKHLYAYNNIATLFNMNKYYKDTIKICSKANLEIPDGRHNCQRNWAFAYHKTEDNLKAIRQIM